MSEVSQPNELIETIEKALELLDKNDLSYEWSRNLENITHNHAEWLRALLEENKRLTAEKQYWGYIDSEEVIGLKGELQQTKEELEQVKKERDAALAYPTVDAYEKACEALWKHRDDAESLRTELSAKDKVFAQLKEIECTIGRFSEDRASFVGQRVTKLYEEMQSILSQYRGEPHE